MMDLSELQAAEVVALVCREIGQPPHSEFYTSDVEIDAAERDLGVKFPLSYRAFLRFFGGQSPPVLGIFGLPRTTWVGDVVMVNYALGGERPAGSLKIKESGGCEYFLETSRMDSRGECPVVVRDRNGVRIQVAGDFVRFLWWEVARPVQVGPVPRRGGCAIR
jgi:hypothetical protein